MPGQNTSAKPAFRLTPKHLLLAAFVVVICAITALIVGVFQTLNTPAKDNTAPRNSNDTVEIWSPRGAPAPTTGGTVVNAPNIPGTPAAPPPVIQPSANESNNTTPAAATRRNNTPETAAPTAPATNPPQQPAARPVQPVNQPPAPAAERPAAAPAPRPAQPAPQRQQPKDVMDNLF